MALKMKYDHKYALSEVEENQRLECSEENESGIKPPKRRKHNNYSKTIMKMMTKMGYESDKGLGKQNQGRLEPVEAFQQTGRSGLGCNIYKSASRDLHAQWDESLDIPEIPEFVSWFAWNTLDSKIDKSLLVIKYGKRITKIDDQDRFCNADILRKMVECKNKLDYIDKNLLRNGRSRSNVFENIRSSIFQNRAAVKMANMDSLLNYMFTNPVDINGTSLVQEKEHLFFADICAGPGGFSEYVLYRRSYNAKGFGLTLRKSNDFQLDKFIAGSPEYFDPFYGPEEDGDIYKESNQKSFDVYIRKHTSEGVHFVMADGGFSVENNENIQEILSKQLYLCQCLTALKILRPNGHFVCKFFDIYTTFSVGLIYLMSRCFKNIAIIKPNSSRPANSERYLICKWKNENNENTKNVVSHLNKVNKILNELSKDEDNDILEIVNDEHLLEQHELLEYIKNSNDRIGEVQIRNLHKLETFCNNDKLIDKRQDGVREQCLKLWELPNCKRSTYDFQTVEELAKKFNVDWIRDILREIPKKLTSMEDLNRHIESVYDWHFVPIGRKDIIVINTTLFVCLKRGQLHYYNSKCWSLVTNYRFNIPPQTIIEGELVSEYSGEALCQIHTYSLHIIDAIMLNGTIIANKPLLERRVECEKFVYSISKPYETNNSSSTVIIRMKPMYLLCDMKSFFNDMRYYVLKNNQKRLGLEFKDNRIKFFTPGGILLLNSISNQFFSVMSQTRQQLYYFHKADAKSYYLTHMPSNLVSILYSTYKMSYCKRLSWIWTNLHQVEQNSIRSEEDVLYRDDIEHYLASKDIKKIINP